EEAQGYGNSLRPGERPPQGCAKPSQSPVKYLGRLPRSSLTSLGARRISPTCLGGGMPSIALGSVLGGLRAAWPALQVDDRNRCVFLAVRLSDSAVRSVPNVPNFRSVDQAPALHDGRPVRRASGSHADSSVLGAIVVASLSLQKS